MANEVSIQLTVEEKQALAAIAKVTRATDKMGDEAVKSGKQMSAAFSSFAGNIAAIGVSKAFSVLTNTISGTVAAAKELEVFETQFKTMLGSTKAAQAQLAELQDFAANTPFQLPGLATSTRQLLSFGVAQEDIIPTLKQLGDVAAGAGAEISELTIPFGRLQASQKLTLIELDKFADRGINIFKELSDSTGVSMGNIRDAVSKGQIPFDEFGKALTKLTSKGGTFFNGMQAQSLTLSGVISTLDDNFFNLQGEMGKAFKPALISSAVEITKALQGMATAFKENGPALTKTLSSIADVLVVTPTKFWSSFFTGEAGAGVTATKEALVGVQEEIRIIEERMAKNKDSTLYNSFFGRKDQDMEELADAFERFGLLVTAKQEAQALEDEATAASVARKLQADADKTTSARNAAIEEEKIQAEKLKVFRKAEDDYGKEMRKREDARQKLEQMGAKQSISLAANTGNLINAISGKQTVVGFALGKAAAAGQVLVADGQARAAAAAAAAVASIPTGGLTFGLNLAAMNALISVNTGLSLGVIAAQSIGGFATGGVVGGFQGSSMGSDNQIASVRSGEMILNASQQRNLFDNINNGGNSDGGDVAAMLAQPIIIQIDNKEIARANRTAIQEGFSAA